MQQDDVAYLAQLLRRRSGLAINHPNPRLIKSRLAPVLRRFGLRDIHSLVTELRHGRDTLARAVTEAMTTNESFFFRDSASFELFRDILLPSLMRRRVAAKRLRIWCAACAAGQEAYSIAMLVDDLKLRAAGWTVDIIATDISADMIERSERGLYSQFEVQRGLPAGSLLAHFTQEGANWRIGESLRRMVTFRQFNLLDSFGWLDDMDIVFCRNVLMYFDRKTKVSILDRAAEILVPDGYLLLGPIETVQGLSTEFEAFGDVPGVFAIRGPSLLRAVAG